MGNDEKSCGLVAIRTNLQGHLWTMGSNRWTSRYNLLFFMENALSNYYSNVRFKLKTISYRYRSTNKGNNASLRTNFLKKFSLHFDTKLTKFSDEVININVDRSNLFSRLQSSSISLMCGVITCVYQHFS